MNTALFTELKESIRQMKAIERGEMPPARVRIVNTKNQVARARAQLGMTQDAFARLLGTPVGTVRSWEQGRRQPPAGAKVLMRVATKYPKHVLECAEEAAHYNSK